MLSRWFRVAVLIFAAAGGCSYAQASAPSRAKLIRLGFDTPEAWFVREHLAELERNTPFDGMAVHLPRLRVNGKPGVTYGHLVFGKERFQASAFDAWLEDAKAIRSGKLTDNFVYVSVTGADYDFFAEEAWETVRHNFALVAGLVRQAGFKGVFFDVEHYNQGKPTLFQYLPGAGRPFAEVEAQARRRGGELMRAITAECPDLVMLTVLGSFSISFPSLWSRNPQRFMENHQYGLTSAFFNGMFDALPPMARLYDGSEFTGYQAAGPEDFFRICRDFHVNSPRLAAPENLSKLQAQSGLAMGLYLDCYLNEDGFWVIRSDSMDRVSLLRRNVRLALESSRDYVWLYGEQCRWQPIELPPSTEAAMAGKIGGGRLWEEAMPGVTAALEFARDPDAYVARAEAENRLEKVFQATFDPPGEPPRLTGVTTWQSGSSKGTIDVDVTGGWQATACARLTGVTFGSVLKSVPVKPGEAYFVRALAQTEGDAQATFTVSWQNADRQWTRRLDEVRMAFSEPLADGWFRASTTVIVPETAAAMYVSCGSASATGQAVMRVDDLEIFLVR